MSNDDQIAFWNGMAGERWVAAQQSMDRLIGPLGAAAMETLDLDAGHRVLDVGCGCGHTSLELAERVGPSGRVFGVDVSRPMLDRARHRAAAGGHRVDFVEADASVAELPEVDRVYSRFGVMFFHDPTAAFARLRGSLVADGRMSFVCWRPLAENPWARVPNEAVSTVLGPPEPVPPGSPGPFAFADSDRLRRILGDAGFRNIGIDRFDARLPWTDGDDEAELRERFVQVGPAARRLADLEPVLRERAIAAMLDAVRGHVVDGRVTFDTAVWIVSASR